ncbi:MFS transporter [Saccharopolyspora shandongensis]|uniref:MFS transporter n=1 Tax=Saccharopolyspora shandongensis TaxID=418495 RepID=UPI0034138F4D
MNATSGSPTDTTATASQSTGTSLLRLGSAWVPGNAAFPMMWSAVTSVLMALQLAWIDPAQKVQNLALLTGIGALITLLVQPIAGRLSDGTRTRWGRRSPWILGGTLGGAISVVLMGTADSIGMLLLAYLLVVVAVNAAQLPMNALLPDRVPRARRGLFASLASIGVTLGALLGQLLAAWNADRISTGYWIIAAIMLTIMVAFVVLSREPSSKGLPRAPLGWRELVTSYWLDPRRHPDFAWVFASRFLLVTGYFLTHSYSLYILQDYIGLGDQAVRYVPLISTVSFLSVLVLSALGGPLSDRVGKRKIFIQISAAVFAVGLVLPLLVPSVPGMIASALIGGLGYGLFGSVDSALMTEVLPSEAGHGKDLGIINLSWGLPQALSPFLASALVSLTGGYTWLFPIVRCWPWRAVRRSPSSSRTVCADDLRGTAFRVQR